MRFFQVYLIIGCLMGLIVASSGSAAEEKVLSKQNQKQQTQKKVEAAISKEDLEIIQKLGLLENLDVLESNDVTFLENYDQFAEDKKEEK